MTDMYHGWNGLVFGYKAATSTRYPLASADDIESLAYNGGLISSDDGRDGASLSPLAANASSWLTVVDVEPAVGAADPAASYIAQRDALKAATIKSDEELAYDIVMPGESTVTRYARCVNRSIPTDEESVVRKHAVAQLEFQASDPFTYGAERTTGAMAIDDTFAFTSTGWADSERWKAVMAGPLTNPQIACFSYGATAIMRYVGVVPSGSSLVIVSKPRYGITKMVINSRVATIETYANKAENAYPLMDRGASLSTVPPAWFKIGGGSQAVSFDATAGSGTCTFTWREAKP